MERARGTDYLTGVRREFSRLVCGEGHTSARSGMKSRFDFIGFSTSDAILSLWFFFLRF